MSNIEKGLTSPQDIVDIEHGLPENQEVDTQEIPQSQENAALQEKEFLLKNEVADLHRLTPLLTENNDEIASANNMFRRMYNFAEEQQYIEAEMIGQLEQEFQTLTTELSDIQQNMVRLIQEVESGAIVTLETVQAFKDMQSRLVEVVNQVYKFSEKIMYDSGLENMGIPFKVTVASVESLSKSLYAVAQQYEDLVGACTSYEQALQVEV